MVAEREKKQKQKKSKFVCWFVRVRSLRPFLESVSPIFMKFVSSFAANFREVKVKVQGHLGTLAEVALSI